MLIIVASYRQQLPIPWQLKEGLKKTKKENIWMAVEKVRKGKRKFERKRKRYKLCREKIDVAEKLKIVRLLLFK